jgi:surface-anchored protein
MIKVLFFKLILFIPPIFLWAESFSFPFMAYTEGHADIGFRIVDDILEVYWKNDNMLVDGVLHEAAPNQPVPFSASEVRALGVFDAETPPLPRPSGSQWDFLGVGPGEDIYILPASGVPNTLPYLGFSTEHPSVSDYKHDDAFKITLLSMTGPKEGVFNLYTRFNSIYLTATTTTASGTRVYNVGDHQHYSWSFSKPGTYDLTFLFEIRSEPNQNNERTVLHSVEETIRFQITEGGGYDNYDHWRRTLFSPADILDETISGPNADAGAVIGQTLGFTNAQRFAFGNNPNVELTLIEIDNEWYPAVELNLRKDTGDLETFPETATDLIVGEWTDEDFTLVESERIHHDPGLERRVYRLNTPATPGPRFFRAGATIESED